MEKNLEHEIETEMLWCLAYTTVLKMTDFLRRADVVLGVDRSRTFNEFRGIMPRPSKRGA